MLCVGGYEGGVCVYGDVFVGVVKDVGIFIYDIVVFVMFDECVVD